VCVGSVWQETANKSNILPGGKKSIKADTFDWSRTHPDNWGERQLLPGAAATTAHITLRLHWNITTHMFPNQPQEKQKM
jgi:hypothetical protein